jgi:hypothetical protein
VPRKAGVRTLRFRGLAASATLSFLSVIAMHGYCPMSAPAAASERMAGAHDCCKTGFNGQKPSCCHADTTPNTVATLKSASAAATLPAVFIRFTPVTAPTPSAIAAAPSVSSHSPPPTVLRI